MLAAAQNAVEFVAQIEKPQGDRLGLAGPIGAGGRFQMGIIQGLLAASVASGFCSKRLDNTINLILLLAACSAC